MRRVGWAALATVVVCVIAGCGVEVASSRAVRAHELYVQQCSSPATSPRNPSNPLDTPGFTGQDPLSGARLFVESPWLFGGDAADAIAQDVGLGYLADQQGGTPIPWAQFKARVNAMRLSPPVAREVNELETIGDYYQAHQFSRFTAGGSGPAIYTQGQNYLCRMQRTDPTATAVITTYFIDDNAGCSGGGEQPDFTAEVDALKAAIGRFSALVFVEEDGVDTICWTSPAAVRGRAALLKYEIDELSQLPHALIYVEAGASDANTAQDAAEVLNAADARRIRGFFLNDTHFAWTYQEIEFGDRIAQLTGGLHFVVDTRANGQGPLLSHDPAVQGVEQLCNPPGRGLGPKPGATNGASYGMYSKFLDGFVWVTTPGESAASTCPGRSGHWAPSGIFDPGIAVGYAELGNDRIGPSPQFSSKAW